MLKPKGLKFKSEKFQWLGSFAAITQILTTWHTSPIGSLADAKSKQGIMSAFAKNHLTYQYVSMANNLLGTKFKIIVGYRGGARNNQAMEQGETHGWVPSWGNLNGTKPHWLAEKKVNLLMLYAFERLPELPNVPTILELVSAKDRPVAEFLINGTPIARSLALPPGVPVCLDEFHYQDCLVVRYNFRYRKCSLLCQILQHEGFGPAAARSARVWHFGGKTRAVATFNLVNCRPVTDLQYADRRNRLAQDILQQSPKSIHGLAQRPILKWVLRMPSTAFSINSKQISKPSPLP